MEKKEHQISPYLVFFLIHSVQVGVGVLSFQRTIMKTAGNDAWIPVIAGGLFINIVIWIMYLLLNKQQKDLVQIHQDLFGKWIGGFFSFIWIIYWVMIGLTIFRTYIEVVQVWVFPMINVIMFSFILIILVYYCVNGGFRIVTGICFFGVLIPFYLFFTFIFPIEYAHFRNLLPVWNHTFKEMAIATKDMTLSYLGISTLLMYYPYIKNPKKSQKWAHFGHLFTLGIYLFLMIISIGFFSDGQVARQIWPTLSLWSIVEMPFVERFEYIGITSWILIILPNICLTIWASTKGIQQMFKIKSKIILLFMLFLLLGSVIAIRGRENIELLNKALSMTGFYLVFIYLPFLTLLSFVISKVRSGKIEKGV